MKGTAPNMTIEENLALAYAKGTRGPLAFALNKKESAFLRDRLAEFGMGLEDRMKTKVGLLSGGQRQVVTLLMCTIVPPKLLLLDEPLNGLDPAGIVEVRELILQLNREHGITFLISSHILSELSLVATKYGIISKGKIVREITAKEMKQECRQSTYFCATDSEKLVAVLSTMVEQEDLIAFTGGARVFGSIDLNAVFAKLNEAGVAVSSVNSREAGIEEFYLSLLGVQNA
jgi:ABC-type multidrug transport system ATPase subunit